MSIKILLGHKPVPPHNLAYTMFGAAMRWFGFNTGSALAANGLAADDPRGLFGSQAQVDAAFAFLERERTG
jgi:ammonia channel protein AmtB